ncbi:MAG TPA: hypothetical protein VGG06_12705 [Thermoanaerobaculia bacterium]
MNRRTFIAGASASTLLAALPGSGGSDAHRIRSLRLATSTALGEMKRFYQETMELTVLAESRDELTIAAGATAITFFASAPEQGAPFYHFAFNIPENKILAARDWQLERTPLIPPWESLRDPDLPDEVVDFRHWNAHSVFFWDPAGNLLEHIARHELGNAASGPFTSGDVLYASEIGLVVDDVPAVAARLRETFGLATYVEGSEQFTPVGDAHGLLLVMKRGRNLGFGEGRPGGVFPTAAGLRASKEARFALPDFPYEVTAA